MSKRRARLTALGRYVPERVMTNADLEKIVDTSDEWIQTRTGIRAATWSSRARPPASWRSSRPHGARAPRHRRPTRSTSSSSATVTPDMLFPSTACLVQDKLGAKRAWGFDISAACSGFLYALTQGARHSSQSGPTARCWSSAPT